MRAKLCHTRRGQLLSQMLPPVAGELSVGVRCGVRHRRCDAAASPMQDLGLPTVALREDTPVGLTSPEELVRQLAALAEKTQRARSTVLYV